MWNYELAMQYDILYSVVGNEPEKLCVWQDLYQARTQNFFLGRGGGLTLRIYIYIIFAQF